MKDDKVTSLDEIRIQKEQEAAEKEPLQVHIEGQTVTIEASDEVILKCGPGSIHLTKDGVITLCGIEIISRAKEANNIKGGKVTVN